LDYLLTLLKVEKSILLTEHLKALRDEKFAVGGNQYQTLLTLSTHKYLPRFIHVVGYFCPRNSNSQY